MHLTSLMSPIEVYRSVSFDDIQFGDNNERGPLEISVNQLNVRLAKGHCCNNHHDDRDNKGFKVGYSAVLCKVISIATVLTCGSPYIEPKRSAFSSPHSISTRTAFYSFVSGVHLLDELCE